MAMVIGVGLNYVMPERLFSYLLAMVAWLALLVWAAIMLTHFLLSTGSVKKGSQTRKLPHAGRSFHKLARPSGNWIRRGDARNP
jgi:L-asparagine transporter-like permease